MYFIANMVSPVFLGHVMRILEPRNSRCVALPWFTLLLLAPPLQASPQPVRVGNLTTEAVRQAKRPGTAPVDGKEYSLLAELLSGDFEQDGRTKAGSIAKNQVIARLTSLSQSKHEVIRKVARQELAVYLGLVSLLEKIHGSDSRQEQLLRDIRGGINELIEAAGREEDNTFADSLKLGLKALDTVTILLWQQQFTADYKDMQQRLFRTRLLPMREKLSTKESSSPLIDIRPFNRTYKGSSLRKPCITIFNTSGKELTNCTVEMEIEGYGGFNTPRLFFIPKLPKAGQVDLDFGLRWASLPGHNSDSVRIAYSCWTDQGKEVAQRLLGHRDRDKAQRLSAAEWKKLDAARDRFRRTLDASGPRKGTQTVAGKNSAISVSITRRKGAEGALDVVITPADARLRAVTLEGCMVLGTDNVYKLALKEPPRGAFGGYHLIGQVTMPPLKQCSFLVLNDDRWEYLSPAENRRRGEGVKPAARAANSRPPMRNKAEDLAAANLAYAQKLVVKRDYKKADERLRWIIKHYPETKGANQAKLLLEKVKEQLDLDDYLSKSKVKQ